MLGPDTSDRVLPAPAVIGFYAAFFFFGAAQYGAGDGGDPIDRLGRWWPAQLVGSLIVFGVLVGEVLATGSVVLEVTAAWMVSFGLSMALTLGPPIFLAGCISRWCSCSGCGGGARSRRSLQFIAVVVATVGHLASATSGFLRSVGCSTGDGHDARLRPGSSPTSLNPVLVSYGRDS